MSNDRANHDSGFRACQDPVLVVKVRTLWEGAREKGFEVKWLEVSEEIQRETGVKKHLGENHSVCITAYMVAVMKWRSMSWVGNVASKLKYSYKIWSQICVKFVEIKCQLDATDDFYCRSYCLLNMFRAPLCPSSGAREYYTNGCYLSYLVLWFSSCRYSVELRVVCPVCGLLQLHVGEG